MTWISKGTHRCMLPRWPLPDDVNIGAVWECDDCGKRWRLYRDTAPPDWREMVNPAAYVSPTGPDGNPLTDWGSNE